MIKISENKEYYFKPCLTGKGVAEEPIVQFLFDVEYPDEIPEEDLERWFTSNPSDLSKIPHVQDVDLALPRNQVLEFLDTCENLDEAKERLEDMEIPETMKEQVKEALTGDSNRN